MNKSRLRTLVIPLLLVICPLALGAQNYTDALQKAVRFFDANKCGPDVSLNNAFDWRGACHIHDGQDVGHDLTGGLHDAGDHVKFGLPQGYTASVLGWALYESRSVFDEAGMTTKLLTTLRYMTDYFLASYSQGRFYYQVGEGNADHAYWGAPEEQTPNRQTYAWADSSHPASDILGQTSAALSLMYLNYRGIDSAYANRCLELSRELFAMGRSNQGTGEGQSFYQSHSYYDDLSWAATWFYVIDGDSHYLEDVNRWLGKSNIYGDIPLKENHWTMCWDEMSLAVMTKLAILTGDSIYTSVVEDNLDYWMHSVTTTPMACVTWRTGDLYGTFLLRSCWQVSTTVIPGIKPIMILLNLSWIIF